MESSTALYPSTLYPFGKSCWEKFSERTESCGGYVQRNRPPTVRKRHVHEWDVGPVTHVFCNGAEWATPTRIGTFTGTIGA